MAGPGDIGSRTPSVLVNVFHLAFSAAAGKDVRGFGLGIRCAQFRRMPQIVPGKSSKECVAITGDGRSPHSIWARCKTQGD